MKFYEHILNSPIMGFAHHLIKIDDEGKPINYEFLEVNNTFEKITGLDKNTIIGKTVTEVIPNIEKSKFDWITFYGNIALNGGESQFEQFAAPLNRWYRVFVYSAEKMYFTTLFIDITEAKQAEDKLRKLSQAVEQSPSVVLITDKNGIIEYVNPKFTEITGYTFDEVIGKTPAILKSGEQSDDFYFRLWQTITLGKDWKSEFHNKKKNGELYWEFANISPIIDENGEITHYLAIKEDITERKRVENELIKTNIELSKSNNEKDKFFSIIAHDLRAPFNGFLGLTKLMSEKIFDLSMKELKEFSQKLLESSENLFELLENLLSWSQMKRGAMNFKPEIIQLKEVVDTCNYMLKTIVESKNQSVEISVNEEILVLADRRMLDTTMRNLFSNASKFTNKGGIIAIEASVQQNEVIVRIKDSGIGIPENIIDKLFIIGEKTSRNGTDDEPSSGLGLILCKEFVEKNQGRLWVESKEGVGSIFYFTIPLGEV